MLSSNKASKFLVAPYLNRIYKRSNISNKTSIVVVQRNRHVSVKDLEGKIFFANKKPIGTADAVKVTLDTISDEEK